MIGNHTRTEYENYVLISENCKYLRGTYEGYIRFKDVMFTLNQMSSKQSNTYTYNGEVYVSRLTNAEVHRIQDALDTGRPSSQLNNLKYVCIDTGIRSF